MDLEKFRNILKQGEGQHTEFKSDFPPQAHKVTKSMSAFTNSGDGFILIGVENDGTPGGIAEPLKAADRLAGMARSCDPPLRPRIDCVRIQSDVTVVYAEFSHSPVSVYDGRVYIRVGATSREASAKEIEELVKSLSPNYTQLDINLKQSREISRKKLRSKAWRGYAISVLLILFYIGLTIYPLFLVPHIAFSLWHFSFLAIAIIASSHILKPYLEEMHLYYNRPSLAQQATYVKQGRFMEKRDEDSYLIYSPTASCIYPYCDKER